MADFINREKEITFFNNWFKSEPNALLFVYGPKSCGKSTLVVKTLQALEKRDYVVNYLDLRGVLLYDFKSFLDIFFQKSKSDKIRGLIEGISINTGFFTIGVDEEGLLKKNPFKVMENQLTAAVKKGKRPIIVIDEIQMLKGIYLNEERFLIDKLFNFFVRLTKVTHLAHLILLTSDSFFISEIYHNSKLNKTTEYYRMEHFSKMVVENWLKQKKLSNKEINYIWKFLGGSPWEISCVLEKSTNNQSVTEVVKSLIQEEYHRIRQFMSMSNFSIEQIEMINAVHEVIATKGFAVMSAYPLVIYELISTMVQEDIWFYEVDKQRIVANSKSIHWAIKRSLT